VPFFLRSFLKKSGHTYVCPAICVGNTMR
jgi:hypothetical protein